MKLLVAVSSVPYPAAALDVIARLVRGADVTLLHVVESRFLGRAGEDPDPKSTPSLVALKERVASAGARAIETLVVDDETPSKAILRESQRRSVDLVVMRGHDRHPGLLRRVFGDTVEDVIEGANRPVLALRTTESSADARRVLVASEGADSEVLDAGGGIARATNSPVTVLHVQPAEELSDFFEDFLSAPEASPDAPSDAKRLLDSAVAALARRGVHADSRLREGNVEEQLALEANSGAYWLLVVRGRSSGPLLRFFLGHNFAEDIVRHVETSILVVK